MKSNHLTEVTPTATESLVFQYTNDLMSVLNQLKSADVDIFVNMLLKMKEDRGTLYICGNGGSAANAIHLANDFTFGISPEGNAIQVEALAANSSVLTCLGNDIGYDNVFAHQLKVKGQPGDILLVLSGSGNSENITKAIEQARTLGMQTVGVLGYNGGNAKAMLDLPFHFCIDDMQISEDTQVILGHILMKALFTALNRQAELHYE